MPRRSANKSGSPVQRRQSARIAAAGASKTPTESPVKKTRRSSKRSSSGKAEPVEENLEQNGAENSSKEVPAVDEPTQKKAKIDEPVDKQDETPKADEMEAHENDSPKETEAVKEAGFEVVDKSTVPAPESEEVKEAISAQGEDGQLLVNYVQVSKDEVPAEANDQGVVVNDAQPTNGSEQNDLCKGDANATENSNGDAVTSFESKQDEVPSDKPPAADVSQ